MKIIKILLLTFTIIASYTYSQNTFNDKNIEIKIEEGQNWKHKFKVFPLFYINNLPQFAIWIEDENGNYVNTIYVTEKVAKEKWKMNGGNRRIEALPYWCHRMNHKYSDGYLMPSKKEPLPDAVTGATSKQKLLYNKPLNEKLKKFYVLVEINHSTDFNNFYTEQAKSGTPNYSGGKMGSGQPALIYSTLINLDNPTKIYELKLTGHSSPDGKDGNIYKDLDNITTAKNIIRKIVVNIKEK